jgi:hypothetical protein
LEKEQKKNHDNVNTMKNICPHFIPLLQFSTTFISVFYFHPFTLPLPSLRKHSSMGCGASSNSSGEAPFVPIVARASSVTPAQQQHLHQETMNVLITCHTDQQNNAVKLRKDLSNQSFTSYIINETTP